MTETGAPMGVMDCLQADVIDMRSKPSSGPNGVYNWILQCKDHASKFIWLFAMPIKDSYQVTQHLRPLFFRFGPPRVLKTDIGEEFSGQHMCELLEQFSCTKHISRSPSPQEQGLIARAKLTLERRLSTWLAENKSAGWADGLAHVEHEINCSWTHTIKATPFQIMFAREPRDFKSANIEIECDVYVDENSSHPTTHILPCTTFQMSNESSATTGGPRRKVARSSVTSLSSPRLHPSCDVILDDYVYADSVSAGYRHFMAQVKGTENMQCLCMGECSNGRCACYKNGSKCTARCHRNHKHVCRNFTD